MAGEREALGVPQLTSFREILPTLRIQSVCNPWGDPTRRVRWACPKSAPSESRPGIRPSVGAGSTSDLLLTTDQGKDDGMSLPQLGFVMQQRQ